MYILFCGNLLFSHPLLITPLPKNPERIVLDLDLTDDPLYGNQEGRFFHGYYDEYCYTPLYIFSGDWPVMAKLRTADEQHLEDTVGSVAKVVAAIRKRHPHAKILVRGDSGFCREQLMEWCQANGVLFLFGLAKNAVLKRIIRGALRSAKSMLGFNKSQSERVFKDFTYKAKKWVRKWRVVGKAEYTPEGENPRFVITNIPAEQVAAKDLYEKDYCARGDMENRIKEQQMDLFADRTSCAQMGANQLRLWFSTLAYLVVNKLRTWALAGTELARATCGTIRLKLFKIQNS